MDIIFAPINHPGEAAANTLFGELNAIQVTEGPRTQAFPLIPMSGSEEKVCPWPDCKRIIII